jgi:hypothetical protein
MKHLYVVFATILLCSCGRHNADNAGVSTSDSTAQFNTFLAKFKPCQLPVRISGCDHMVFPDGHELDYLKDTTIDGVGYAYGTIKSNGDYITVVSLAAADCLLPFITTFDKLGNKIDQNQIAIAKCGDGPGFTCHETMVIGTDYSLFTVDTMTSQETDSLDNIIAGGKTSTQVIYRKGKLLTNGKIELSEEVSDTLHP